MASRAPTIALCVGLAAFVGACATATYRQVPPAVPQDADNSGGGAIGLPSANSDYGTEDVASWGPPGAAAFPPDAAGQNSSDPAARGRYLAVAGDCKS